MPFRAYLRAHFYARVVAFAKKFGLSRADDKTETEGFLPPTDYRPGGSPDDHDSSSDIRREIDALNSGTDFQIDDEDEEGTGDE